MKVFGIIPARGGSKAIPNKNLVPLLNKPLLSYTCEAVRQSRRLSRTILSTDSEEIAAVGRALGIEVPFLRPPELAQDETPMLEVLLHAMAWAYKEAGEPCAVVLLQPTSPPSCRTYRRSDRPIFYLTRRHGGLSRSSSASIWPRIIA